MNGATRRSGLTAAKDHNVIVCRNGLLDLDDQDADPARPGAVQRQLPAVQLRCRCTDTEALAASS